MINLLVATASFQFNRYYFKRDVGGIPVAIKRFVGTELLYKVPSSGGATLF
jgi:hypothetical protein